MRDQMNTDPKTKTPETDAMQRIVFEGRNCIVAAPEDIETLERERDEARADLQKWKEQLSMETAGGPTGDLMRTSRAWQSVRAERDQLRAEVERLTNENTLLSEGPAAAGWWSPATVKAYEKDHAALRGQLAARDDALKVAGEAILELLVQLQHVEDMRGRDPATLTPNIISTGRAALRRIEELTKEKQPHE